MKENRPSFTAAWVAACRGLTPILPPDVRLADDPLGARFAGSLATSLRDAALRMPAARSALWHAARPFLQLLLWMQLRTRALDDIVAHFVSEGGRQLVLLGAGFDARAARLAGLLEASTVFEIDHPATQARKREVMTRAGGRHADVRYLSWNFERSLEGLPDALAGAGHDVRARTLTIWEGVTPYLTESAIDASVRAVAAWSAPGSQFAFTYFHRRRLERPRFASRWLGRVVAMLGEPFRFGWDPEALPTWLALRGFELVSDREDAALAREYLLGPSARLFVPNDSHVALAKRVPSGG